MSDELSAVSGAPRSVATGDLIPDQEQAPHSGKDVIGEPIRLDGEEVAPVTNFLTPEEQAERERQARANLVQHQASIAAGIPPEFATIMVAGLPMEGADPLEFTGDPEEPIMPGTFGYYWINSNRRGWLEPQLAMIVAPLIDNDGKLTGAYKGHRFRPIYMGMYVVSSTRPSPVPKLGYFTPIRRYPPEACQTKPGE